MNVSLFGFKQTRSWLHKNGSFPHTFYRCSCMGTSGSFHLHSPRLSIFFRLNDSSTVLFIGTSFFQISFLTVSLSGNERWPYMATEREKETYEMAAVKVHQLTRIRKMSLLFQTQHNVTELIFLILGLQKHKRTFEGWRIKEVAGNMEPKNEDRKRWNLKNYKASG